MAVKNLKSDAQPAAHHSSSNKFSRVFTKMVSFGSRNNSGKEEPRSSSLSPRTGTIRKRSSELQRVFCYFDENGDGTISASELRNCMRSAGEELTSEEAEVAVRLSDSDGDGKLGIEDFAKLVEAEDEQEKDKNLMDAFKMYEMDGRGCITPKSLCQMLRRLGEDRTVEDCMAMIGRFDLNGDGVLSFEEFKIMMQ